MGKYIVAVDGSWDPSMVADWTINYWWAVSVNSVQDLVDKVLAEVGNDKISNLVIVGHGKPGVQNISGGHHPNENQILFLDTFGEDKGKLAYDCETILSPLRGKFEWNGKVSLGGCQTGEGIKGQKLLKRLAYTFGVMVEAGIETQRVMPGYEGPVLRCNKYFCWTLPAYWTY